MRAIGVGRKLLDFRPTLETSNRKMNKIHNTDTKMRLRNEIHKKSPKNFTI